MLALISLGYKQVDAHKAIKQTFKSGGEVPKAEDLVRLALENPGLSAASNVDALRPGCPNPRIRVGDDDSDRGTALAAVAG